MKIHIGKHIEGGIIFSKNIELTQLIQFGN